MRNNVLFAILILILFADWRDADSAYKKINSNEVFSNNDTTIFLTSEVFAPVLKKELIQFMKYVDSISSFQQDSKWFYVIFFSNEEGRSYVTLHTEYYYNPDLTQIGGYTFFNNRLIVYLKKPMVPPLIIEDSNVFSKVVYNAMPWLIDTTKLIEFQDSLSGYNDAREGIGEYEPIILKFQIINSDSLLLQDIKF